MLCWSRGYSYFNHIWFHLLKYFVRGVLMYMYVLTGSQSCMWWFSTTQASSSSTCSASAVDFSSCLNEQKNISREIIPIFFYFKLKKQLRISIKVFFFLISNVLKAMDVLEYISFSNGKPALTNDEISLRIPCLFILLE